jgi:hypothetical protein
MVISYPSKVQPCKGWFSAFLEKSEKEVEHSDTIGGISILEVISEPKEETFC